MRSASLFRACLAFPHFAHNAQVAWCVTHAFADIHDLYVEQFDRADPSRYLHKGDWLQAATTTEDIKVRGADSDPVQIVETIHGPVVAGDPAHGAALTLKSVQFFDLDRSFDCLLPMLRQPPRWIRSSRPYAAGGSSTTTSSPRIPAATSATWCAR